MSDSENIKTLTPSKGLDFLAIAKNQCDRYGIYFPTLEYGGGLLSDREEQFNIDCVFFIHHISISMSHIYQSKLIIEYAENKYQLRNCEQCSREQINALVDYFTLHGFSFKGWLFDHWLEYIAVNTLLFHNKINIPTVPVRYALTLDNDVVVNDICASSFDRFMNPIRADFYAFNLEMHKADLDGLGLGMEHETGNVIDGGMGINGDF